MEIYGYLVELLKKIKGPCGLKLCKDAWFEKTSDKEVALSIATNCMDLFVPIHSIESLDAGFVVNGNVSVNINGKLEFHIKDLDQMMIESMIKDSINFDIPCTGFDVQFFDGKMKFGPMEVKIAGQKVKVEQVGENFEINVGSSKIRLPWNSYIVIDKQQFDDVVGDIEIVNSK